MVKSRRQQQTEETRNALVRAGKDLFGTLGFADASAEEIVSRARVTRGALYHHFPNGKRGLFEAVARELQAELVKSMSDASQGAKDPWNAMRAAIAAYFEFANVDAYQKISLQDAPAVIGAADWRAIEHEYTLKFIEHGIEHLIETGEIGKQPIPMLASTIFGACCEATLSIANSKEPEKARAEATKIILKLIKGLQPRQ